MCLSERVGIADGVAPPVRTVQNLRVFFGHQSVGDNILDGVRQIAPELRIVRAEAPVATPAIIESLIGRNGAPESKLAHFARVMQAMGDQVDVAMMRFCYVDFSADTDLRALEQQYRDTLSSLTSAHRKTRFMHITVPLTVTQTGPKAIVKRLLGKPVWGELENQKRSQFNDWLRGTYAADPIFDLAAIESRTPSGEPVTFELAGHTYPMLYAPYSDDGQHLAEPGRRVVARALLDLLGRLAKGPTR